MGCPRRAIYRCRYLARCYTPLKKYAEALTLMQHGALHLREARQALSLLPPSSSNDSTAPPEDPINLHPDTPNQPAFYAFTPSDVSLLDDELSADSLQCKKDWFTFNGGQTTSDAESSKTHKKPLFFDIALNYVQLDMERLQERAGKEPGPAVAVTSAAEQTPRLQYQSQSSSLAAGGAAGKDGKSASATPGAAAGLAKSTSSSGNLSGKTLKVEAAERERTPTPEPSSQPARGGLGGLLGGWWGRK